MASNVGVRVRVMTTVELAAAQAAGVTLGRHEYVFVSDAAAGTAQWLRGTGASIASAETTQTAGQTASQLNNFTATTAPGVGDDSADGYSVGSRWVDTAADESYICVDATAGAAVWSRTTVGTIGEVAGLQSALDGKEASITTLALSKGGTGSGTATGARTNLGLGGAAVLGVGTTTGTVAAGDDSRMTNARTPTSHAASHGSAGADAITPANIGAEPTIAAGGLPITKGGTGATTAAGARTALGLGTAAVADTGTVAGRVPVLDAAARLPAVDGSQLLGISASLPGGTNVTAFDEGMATTGSPTIDRAAVPGFTILRWTGAGSFTPPSHITDAEVLVVGGGGGGGGGETNSFGGAGGGGGGGRVIANATFPVAGTLNLTVGAGGAVGAVGSGDTATNGGTGTASTFGALTAGGGGGGHGDSGLPADTGFNGGGGSGDGVGGAAGTGQAGGNAGGAGGSGRAGGGGGGAGGAGEAAGVDGVREGGDGGAGVPSTITGTSVIYGAGGGGAGNSNGGQAAGGASGAGDSTGIGDTSANNTTTPGTGGTAGGVNRGGGGGGGCGRNGFLGGAGVVIVRFPTNTRTYQTLLAFASDATAATGGVLVGQFYRDSTSGAVRQRVT